MLIKVPSPLHGWRVFAGEVGVIVLGVLIALALGEVADGWRWDVHSRQSIASLQTEQARNAGVFEERTLVQPCIERRLEEVAAILHGARRTRKLPEVGKIGSSHIRPIHRVAWDLAVDSGAIPHFRPEESKRWAWLYSQSSNYYGTLAQEKEHWALLSRLEGAAGALSDSMLVALSDDLARLRWYSWRNGIVAEQQLAMSRQMGLAPDYFLLFDRDGATRSEMVANARTSAICQALIVDGAPLAQQAA